MRMDLVQIVTRTVVTTIDLFVASVAFMDGRNNSSTKKILALFIVANLVGVWI